MKLRWAFLSPWIIVAVMVLAVRAEAQTNELAPGSPPPMGGNLGQPIEGYVQSPEAPQYAQGAPMPGGPVEYSAAEYGGYAGDAYGEEAYGGGRPYRGILGDVIGLIGPYGEGGACAPRWFDLGVEAMWLKREDTGRNVVFSSLLPAGNIALESKDLNFGSRPSFRFNGNIQWGSGGSMEFVYYGLFHWSNSAQVTSDTDDLYSAMSKFGTDPVGGFAEESLSRTHRIEFGTSFDNFEWNYRHRWQGPGCRYQGSWLGGVRYFKTHDNFNFITLSPRNSAMMNYDIDIDNSLTGGQLGGDLWITIIPGLRAGTEFKAGVFGNHASQGTVINATSLNNYTEYVKGNDVGFVTDANFFLTYRLNHQWNLKFGYNMLYVNGLAVGPENFNPTPPALNNLPPGVNRQATLNQHGDAFYHGTSVGVEWNW